MIKNRGQERTCQSLLDLNLGQLYRSMGDIVIHTIEGFGDALMLQPIVRHYVNQKKKVFIKTYYPQCFDTFVRNSPEYVSWDYPDKDDLGYTFNYYPFKSSSRTQFKDLLLSGGIEENLNFRIEHIDNWTTHGLPLGRRKLCVVRYPAQPLAGVKGNEVLYPDYDMYRRLITTLRKFYYVVCVGSRWTCNETMCPVDLDLSMEDRTASFNGHDNYSTLLNMVRSADLVITPMGHMVHLAEGYGRNLFVLFSQKGLNSPVEEFNTIRPEKMLLRRTSMSGTDKESVVSLSTKILKRFYHKRGIPSYCRPMWA